MVEENTIIINNYAGTGSGEPLPEIDVGREVARWEAETDVYGWYFGFPDGDGKNVDIKSGKVYTLYEEDA